MTYEEMVDTYWPEISKNFQESRTRALDFMKSEQYQNVINGTVPYIEQLEAYGYPVDIIFDKREYINQDMTYATEFSKHVNKEIQEAMELLNMNDIRAAKMVLRRIQFTVHNHTQEKPSDWIPKKARTPEYSTRY